MTPTGPVTYAARQRLTDRAAGALRALGVEAEQRVALLMADRALLGAAGIDPAAAGARAVLDFDTPMRDAPAGPLHAEPVGADAMAFWLYTSGTTGSPKAAVHCHRTLPDGQ